MLQALRKHATTLMQPIQFVYFSREFNRAQLNTAAVSQVTRKFPPSSDSLFEGADAQRNPDGFTVCGKSKNRRLSG